MSEGPHLLTTIDDGILIATFNRPDKLNALSEETLQLFDEAILRFRDSDEIRVMLIRATGRYFCAGVDLTQGNVRDQKFTATGVREMHRVENRGMHRIFDEMEHIEKPIVVAHHAMCVGGGLELSLSCDFRLAAKSAGYAFPEGLFGVLPASNGVSRLTRICGPHWARWLVMANKLAPADMAFTMGLVHQVFPDESFEADVMDFCRQLVGQNGEQMGTAKVAIELCADLGRDAGRHVERMGNSGLMLNPGYAEGLEAYIAGKVGKAGASSVS